MMKIEDVVKMVEQSSSPRFIAGPIVVKVTRNDQREDKTIEIADETDSIYLHLQHGTNPLIQAGAVLRFFALRVESNRLLFTSMSLVDTARKIAQKEVLELPAQLEPWFSAEVAYKDYYCYYYFFIRFSKSALPTRQGPTLQSSRWSIVLVPSRILDRTSDSRLLWPPMGLSNLRYI